MPEKTVKQWITIRGRHIPIFEGESKEDAINRLKEGAKKGRETTKMHAITNRVKKKEAFDKAAKKSHQKSQAFDSNPTERRKKAYEKAHEETQKAYKEYVDAKNGKVPAHFNFGEGAIKGNKNTGNKESNASGLEPSKELGQALYSGSKTGISQELNKLEEGTKVRFRVNGNTRTYTRKGKGFVNEYGQPETRTHVADLLSRSWKNGRDSTLAGFYENNLKITSPVKKQESAVKANPTEIKAASKPATAKPAVTEESIQKELSRTATRLASKGYNTPESIEKHIRELSSIRKNDLAKKMGIGGRGEEKIKAMVAKIHEQQQGGKKAEPAKSSYDVEKELDLGTKFDNGNALKSHLKSHGYKVHPAQRDPEDRDFVSYPFTAPNGDEGYVDMVRARGGGWEVDDVTNVTAHERRQKEKEKSWQDKDAETKAKQIANAEKQKAAAQEAQEPVYKNPVKAQEDMRERHEQRMIQEKEKAFANKNDSWEPKVGDRIGDVGYNQAENKLFNAPAGTVIEMNSRDGDYIGEYTKQEDGSWKGSQKYRSRYGNAPTVKTAKGFAMQVVGKDVKVMNVPEKKQEVSTVEPSRLFGNALWNQSNRDMTKELKGLEEGTQVSFRTAAGRRTWTRYGTGFVDDSGKTYSNMAVAGLLIGAWKHGGSSTLGQFYKDNLKLSKRN